MRRGTGRRGMGRRERGRGSKRQAGGRGGRRGSSLFSGLSIRRISLFSCNSPGRDSCLFSSRMRVSGNRGSLLTRDNYYT